jgi:hypothetical protein
VAAVLGVAAQPPQPPAGPSMRARSRAGHAAPLTPGSVPSALSTRSRRLTAASRQAL